MDAIDRMIDPQRGIVSREIFVSPDYYREELEKLFARAWLFVGHESQIPKPGDFFVSRMGEEFGRHHQRGARGGRQVRAEVTFPLNPSATTKAASSTRRRTRSRRPTASRTRTRSTSKAAGRRCRCDPEFGGQGLPHVVNQCLYEMLN